MTRARSTMRARRLVSTLSVTPIAEIKKIGVSAIWMRCAISKAWTGLPLKLNMAHSRFTTGIRSVRLPASRNCSASGNAVPAVSG